jgi:hypothetical protein
MSKWPFPTYEVSSIVSGSPDCTVCDQPAEKFVQVRWGLGVVSDHPVCERHLQMYRTDFDHLGADLRRVATRSRTEDAQC